MTLTTLYRVLFLLRLSFPCLSCLLLAALISAAQAGQLADPTVEAALRQGLPQRVIVEYREAPPAAEAAAARRTRRLALKQRVADRLAAHGISVDRHYSELPSSALKLNGLKALAALLADPEVEVVYADRPLKPHLAQALPLIGQPFVANVMGRQGAGTTIAILDTGIDYTRPEFGSCTAPGVPSTCKIAAMVEAAASDGVNDSAGHGTEVAMTALAVAPAARLIGIDVFNGNSASTADVITGINWAISNRSAYNIVVLNLSLGDGIEHTTACGRTTDAFYTPVNSARSAGMLVVASSGNEGYVNGISSPACVANATAVGAVYDATLGGLSWQLTKYDSVTRTTSTTTCTDAAPVADQVTCFSDSSSLLDLLAPGALITLGGSDVAGTSFSAPFVAGAVAVLKAQFPGDTPAQTEARLTSTGKPVTDVRNNLTKPRLDLLAAQGAPSNDAFASAVLLSGAGGSAAGWNVNATRETGEPSHAGQVGGRSVWWKWTAPASGTLWLSTAGSGIDTLLGLYTGSTVSALTTVAANDDDGGAGGTSSLGAAVTAGQTYWIAVDGKNGAQGALSLAWSSSATAFLADLSVSLSAAPATVTLGAATTLQVVVANAGPQVAKSTTVSVSLPAGWALDALPAACSRSGATVNCSVADLAAGASQTLTWSVTPDATGAVNLGASTGSAVPDPAASNNAASQTVVVAAAPASGEPGAAEVPLPAWALAALGLTLAGMLRHQARHRS